MGHDPVDLIFGQPVAAHDLLSRVGHVDDGPLEDGLPLLVDEMESLIDRLVARHA